MKFDNLRKEVKDIEDIVKSLEAEEDDEVAEVVEEVKGEESTCVCAHCGTAEVVYRDGKPYSVDGDTSTEALMMHGII